MALQKGDCMGPVEAGLVHGYDDVRRKFFPLPKHQESSVLARTKQLEADLSTSQKIICELNNRLSFLEKLFKPVFLSPDNPPQSLVSVEAIIRLVSKTEGVKRGEIISGQRLKCITDARHLVYYLAATLTFCSLPQIGRLLGDRDHTTILHGKKKIARLRASDIDLDAKLTRYEQQLLAPAETIT